VKSFLYISLFAFSVSVSGQSQSTEEVSIDKVEYKLSKSLDYALGLSAIGLGILDYKLNDDLAPLDLVTLRSLNPNQVSKFDRSAINNFSESAADISDVLEYAALGLPLPFLLSDRSRKEFGDIMIMYAEAIAINSTITTLVKVTVKRNRPFTYNTDLPDDIKLNKGARKSFFSGHTSHAAVSSYFTAKVFADLFPDSKWKPVVWGAAAAYPAFMGYFRVKAGRHFPTDTIAGYAVGAIVGYLIPDLHKVTTFKNATIRFSGSQSVNNYPINGQGVNSQGFALSVSF